jgi:uncharacterized protein YcnI
MTKKLLLIAAAAALVGAPAAYAHVTLNPDTAKAGSFSRFAIRVPNERDKAATTRLTVQIPAGLEFVGFQVKPGWKRTVEKSGSRIVSVTWTATALSARIRPGEFDEFGLSAKLPARKGTVLVFPAIQHYSNGEDVRWIGPPSADRPAPRVRLM